VADFLSKIFWKTLPESAIFLSGAVIAWSKSRLLAQQKHAKPVNQEE
jgi:hypothetical protein